MISLSPRHPPSSKQSQTRPHSKQNHAHFPQGLGKGAIRLFSSTIRPPLLKQLVGMAGTDSPRVGAGAFSCSRRTSYPTSGPALPLGAAPSTEKSVAGPGRSQHQVPLAYTNSVYKRQS